MQSILNGLRRAGEKVLKEITRTIVFMVLLLIMILWGRKFSRYKKSQDAYVIFHGSKKTDECLKCPLHCPQISQDLQKPENKTKPLPFQHTIPPVPETKFRTKKLTRLQLARQRLKKELSRPSNLVNVNKVKKLKKEIGRLENHWRNRSRAQKRAWRQRKQMMAQKVLQKSLKHGGKSTSATEQIKVTSKKPYSNHFIRDSQSSQDTSRLRKPTTSLPPISVRPPVLTSKPKLRRPTRLQITRQRLKKELSRPSKSININKVKELEKKIERLEEEWRNRSRAQKRAWRWRKKLYALTTSKTALRDSRIAASPSNTFATEKLQAHQQIEQPSLNKTACLFCPLHCPSAKSEYRHWKVKAHIFLLGILKWLNSKQKGQSDGLELHSDCSAVQNIQTQSTKPGFWQKIRKWFYYKTMIKRLFQKMWAIIKHEENT